jgi:hypothetical protein
MKRQRVARLLIIAAAIDPTKFSMNEWRTDIFGAAANDPGFQAEGLTWGTAHERPTPFFGSSSGYDACAEFFEIDYEMAENWLNPHYYSEWKVECDVPLEAVIRRITADLANTL